MASLRAARKSDVNALTLFMDMAGHGMPLYSWQQQHLKTNACSALEIGRERILSETHALSYRNFTIAEIEGEIVGGMLSKALHQANSVQQIAEMDPAYQPLARLENEVVGSYYIDIMAVFPEFQGRGIGGLFFEYAEQDARKTDQPYLSLIARSYNPAIRLYERMGYSEKMTSPVYDFPGGKNLSGHWVLMTKEIDV